MQPSATLSPRTKPVSVPKGQHDIAPISKLHRDVLWHIFMKNADMGTTGRCHDLKLLPTAFSALTTARWSSQVCRHWRDVMLSSSLVWSRCIDLDHLKHPHWRDEVLLRTGQSPLHVKGIIATPDQTMFLLSLLDTNWERIRELEIEMVGYSAVDDVRWGVFLRPAPTMQSVVIAFPSSYETDIPDILSTQINTIFADHAPALRRFASSNILFRIPSSSQPQLRHLDLKGNFAIAMLLSALSQMLCLEYLSICRDQTIENIPMSKFPHTEFPRLSYISLYGSIGGCLTLLEHIIPAPGCSLILDASSADWVADMRARVPVVLLHYAKNFFDSHIASELDLKIRNNRFSLSCEEVDVPSSDLDSRRLPVFIFDIESITGISLLPLDSLLYTLSTCRFDKVTTLAIHLLPSESDFCNTNFTPFITSLHSLETLETTQDLFDILFKTNESHLFFPSLKKIIYTFYTPFPLTYMKTFLFQRQELGIPIQGLEISPRYSPFSYLDMRLLDTLTGLRLKWKEGNIAREYICGSGKPEGLNLAKNRQKSGQIIF